MKTCAWISRHEPTAEQRRNLTGYRIVQINPPGRLWGANDALALSQTMCKGWPDLFVVVMPILMLKRFVELVDGHVPVVRSVVKMEQKPTWIPPWEQVLAVHFETVPWMPEGKEKR